MNKRLKQIIDYITSRNKKQYTSLLFISVGYLLLIDHLYNAGYSWNIEELFTCHGFIGFALIITGFVLGIKQIKILK